MLNGSGGGRGWSKIAESEALGGMGGGAAWAMLPGPGTVYASGSGSGTISPPPLMMPVSINFANSSGLVDSAM